MNSTFHFSHLTNKISEWKIFLTHLSDENKTQKRKMDKNCKKGGFSSESQNYLF